MKPLEAFIDVRCLCGKVHAFLREGVVDALGTARRKCGSCKRRFVIACTPGSEGQPDSYWPLFLEQVPSTGATQQEGISTDEGTKPDAPRNSTSGVDAAAGWWGGRRCTAARLVAPSAVLN